MQSSKYSQVSADTRVHLCNHVQNSSVPSPRSPNRRPRLAPEPMGPVSECHPAYMLVCLLSPQQRCVMHARGRGRQDGSPGADQISSWKFLLSPLTGCWAFSVPQILGWCFKLGWALGRLCAQTSHFTRVRKGRLVGLPGRQLTCHTWGLPRCPQVGLHWALVCISQWLTSVFTPLPAIAWLLLWVCPSKERCAWWWLHSR